jgi:hypothetical protein
MRVSLGCPGEEALALLARRLLATTSIVSLPTSILVFGRAIRLRYQSGWFGAPPFAAQTR